MATWNYLVDIWEEQDTTVFWEASYLQDIQTVIEPTSNIPETAEQEIDLASFGLENMDEYQMMVNIKEQWGTWEDFRNILGQSRADKAQKVEEEVTEDSDSWILETIWGWLTSFKEWTEDTIGWGIANVPNIIWNTLWFLADVVTPKQFEWLGDVLREWGIKDQKQLQDMLWVDPDTLATAAWEIGTDIGTLLIPWGQANLTTKFPLAAEKIATLSTAINNLWNKAPKIFNTLKSAVTWAKEFGKFEAITEWEVTKEWLATWAIANPLIGSTIRWVWFVSKKLAEKLQLAWLLNPAKLDKVAKQLKTDWVEEVSSVADFLLKKNIKWSKEAIVKDLFADATKSRLAVDTALKSIKKESFDKSSQKAIELVKANLAWKAWLEDDLARVLKLEEKLQTKWLTTFEKNWIKRDLDKFINIFKDSWEIIAGTNKLGASNIRLWVQKQIEKEAKESGIKNIKELNKNTQVSFTLAESIARKDAADQASALINAFAPSWAWAIIWWVGSQWDVFDRLQGVIGWALLWRAAWSTTVKTNIANILNKLSWLEKFAFEEFIKNKWRTELSPEIINKFIK